MKKLPDSPPAPFDVSKELASIPPGMFDRLVKNYGLAWRMCYAQSRAGIGGEIARNGHSDPTGDVVAEKERARNSVAFAGRKIMEAVAALDGADDALSKLTEWAGKYERVRHRAGEQVLLHNPSLMALAKKEQTRRTRRKTQTA